MRKLLWFSAGFAGACAFAAYILSTVWLFAVAAALFVAAVVLLLLPQKRTSIRITAVILLGAAVGFAWYQTYDLQILADVRKLDDISVRATVVASEYVRVWDSGTAVDGQLLCDDGKYNVRVYLPKGMTVKPDDRIVGEFSLSTPGNGNGSFWYIGEGIHLIAYADPSVRIYKGDSASPEYFAANLRNLVLKQIDKVFPSDTVAFAKALLLGETNTLSYETDTHLKISGIRHVVAVSGLHVSILMSALYFLFGRRRGLAFCVGMPILLVFAAVCEFSPSILRACIMQLLMLFGMWIKREYDPLTGLATAVIILLAIDPQTIMSAGFQLSVASVLGILLFASPIYEALFKKTKGSKTHGKLAIWIKRYISTSVSVSLSALIFTTPLTAIYFGTVSILAVLTNLLCLWLITFLFVGILAVCLLGYLLPLAGVYGGWLLSWLIRGILLVAKGIASVPIAAVYTESEYIVAWLILSYALFGVLCIRPKLRSKELLCMIPLTLCAAILCSWILPRMEDYRITVLDVGQGQCILLESGGRTYMVDCGGDSDKKAAEKAAMYLASRGIFSIDGMILTHYDQDHVGGAKYLLKRLLVDQLYLPSSGHASFYTADLVSKNSAEQVKVRRDICIQWGGAEMTIFAGDGGADDNENSLCVLFQTEKCGILITGDRSAAGEAELLSGIGLPQVDILVAGHHGAASSTSEALLDELCAKTVVISVGAGNSYGHPSKALLKRLEYFDCDVYRTDLQGTIIFRGEPLWQRLHQRLLNFNN